jgi:adenosylcobinamide hydrolase
VEPTVTARREGGYDVPLLVWRLPAPMRAVSSGPLGGGIGVRHWVLNATVPMSYDRDDPDAHLAELANGQALTGPGIGLLTGLDVARVVRAADGGVSAWATAGLDLPAWAAAPAGDEDAHQPGTVNVVAFVPVRLSDAALVNAVATVAEAKAQALWELGLHGTGTPTDATCVLCPIDGRPEPYAGPRSTWGARLARATHGAVRTGGAAYLAGGVPWSPRPRG